MADLTPYERTYLADQGYERRLSQHRRAHALEVLAGIGPEHVVEIGCATDPLCVEAARGPAPPKRWVVVEPEPRFAAIAEEHGGGGCELHVLNALFEDVADEVRALRGDGSSVTLCLGVLQAVEDQAAWLEGLRGTMREGDVLVLTVANAASMHRRLARAMGLVDDLHELSERDRGRGHHHVLDHEQTRTLISEAGLAIRAEHGIVLKPFTHAQMDVIGPLLGDDVLDGLAALGRDVPELACEMSFVAEAT